ncbi:MAG: prepilin-type N-terminal cleavage/methylation domain-containing protein [Candidatus Wildermuthbacteria bacterium]|nr:prepilin-type N-terminal cleavage/methylation domain-containing protein [Candidatus Wildermuthbacteria bacterium]
MLIFGKLNLWRLVHSFFKRKSSHAWRKRKKRSFTLIELLIVIAVLGILANIVFVNLSSAKEKAYFARAKQELRSIALAAYLYKEQNGKYPSDADRGIDPDPANFGNKYLGGWPVGPWPGTLYDWDFADPNDPPPNGTATWYVPCEEVYQVGLRFCPEYRDDDNNLTGCTIPKLDWAANFKANSSIYYCISGPCRSHHKRPMNYPGYCLNCAQDPASNPDQTKCF